MNSLLLLLLLHTQPLRFEAATVKVAPPRDIRSNVQVSAVLCHGIDNQMPDLPAGVPGLGRCLATNMNLRAVVGAAYASAVTIPLRQRVLGGPDWIDNVPLNIEGKAEDPSSVTEAQLKSMLQQLLSERFKLQVHTETKEVQGFALVVAKDGPKLKAGSGEPSAGFRFSGNTMSSPNATLQNLASSLSVRVGGPVIDRTGLTGRYAITLPANIGNDPNSTSASTALQELGLRLESEKLKIDIIVIDQVERPVDPGILNGKSG